MRTPKEQLEFERQLRDFVRSGGRVMRYSSDERGETKLTSQWQLVGPEARRLNEQRRLKGKKER